MPISQLDRVALTISQWKDLSSASSQDAANRICQSVGNLTPATQKAVFAHLFTKEELTASFTRARQTDSPLSGVPYVLKDNYDVAGTKTHAGSTFLPEERPSGEKSAPLYIDMEKQGAVLTGKTHMQEFAYGLEGNNAHYGDCPHPQFSDRISGGSSSGSAFCVGAGIVPFSFGSDTGGSIRVPAASCGIYGIRLVPDIPWSSEGVMPLARSYDVGGWFARNLKDMLLLNRHFLHANLTQTLGKGLYIPSPAVEISPELTAPYARMATLLGAETNREVEEVLCDLFADTAATYLKLTGPEAYEDHSPWFERRKQEYDPAVKARMEKAGSWSQQDITQAARHRDELADTLADAFVEYDYIVTPAIHAPSPKRSDLNDQLRGDLLQLNAPASICRLPALSIPVPLEDGRSGGLQIIFRNLYSCVPIKLLEQLEG